MKGNCRELLWIFKEKHVYVCNFGLRKKMVPLIDRLFVCLRFFTLLQLVIDLGRSSISSLFLSICRAFFVDEVRRRRFSEERNDGSVGPGGEHHDEVEEKEQEGEVEEEEMTVINMCISMLCLVMAKEWWWWPW